MGVPGLGFGHGREAKAWHKIDVRGPASAAGVDSRSRCFVPEVGTLRLAGGD